MLIWAGKQYLEQLEILSAYICECGSNLANMLAGTMADRDKFASKIKDAERSAHDRSKQLIARLNRTPIKPLDQKTLRDLAVLLTEILHGIARAGNRFVLYQIDEPGTFLSQISQKLLQQATLINVVFAGISKGDCVLGQCEEIIQLDKEVERLLESGELYLFASERDPIEVIKRKQVFDEFRVLAEQARRIADFVKHLALTSTSVEGPHAFWRRRGA
jgi:uncharacterized protein Yka (UPF0111/DUF47 family)